MKSRFFRAAIAGAILAAFFSLNIHAGPKAKMPADVTSLLAEAYADLDRADHDYKGHRIKAMEQIDRAGKVLKLNLRGDGHGHEKQGVSDEQLAAAQGILGQIQSQLAGEKKSRVLNHVNKAQEELAIALKIK
jgi:hypothetical protein